MHYGMDGDWWIAMVLMMAAFWGGLIVLAAWLVRSLADGNRRETPAEIAERRYARGEITDEEFQRIRGNLGPGRTA